jgi:peroxiredoxin Q/BCP
VVLGVSYDSVEDNRNFAEKFDFPFDLLSDTDQGLARAYGAFDPGRPEYARRISYVISPEGKIAAAFEKVTPKDHPQEVLGLLRG